MATQHIKSRLSSYMNCLSSVLNYSMPQISAELDDANDDYANLLTSRNGLSTLLAPIFADLASTSNLFWTGGRSEVNRGPSEVGSSLGDLETTVGRACNDFCHMVCTGHTEASLSFRQAARLLDCIEVFVVGHASWKTRIFGLLLQSSLITANLSVFLNSSPEAEALRQRIKRVLVEALADPWIEVARSACETLSVLVRFGVLNVSTCKDFPLSLAAAYLALTP